MTDVMQPPGEPVRRSVVYQRPKTTSRRVLVFRSGGAFWVEVRRRVVP